MIIKLVKNYFILLTFFLVSLTLVSLIPDNSIKSTIGKSIKTLKHEGLYPSIGLPHREIILDNFTDALILNTSYSVNSKKPFESFITNKRYSLPNTSNQITSLDAGYTGKTTQKVGYERYWHGNMTYLRPLLTIFSYSQIRNLLYFLLYGCFIAFIYLSKQKFGALFAIATIFSFIAVDFFYLGHSLQFSPVFLLGLLAGIFLLKLHKSNFSLFPLFFMIGGLTSFFDLLTAPLISLSIPLVVAIQFNRKKLREILQLCLSWTIGYAGLWASKWFIAAATFSPNAIHTAFDQLLNRTINKADVNFTHINTLKLNLYQLIGYDSFNRKFILVFFIFCFIFFAFFNKISFFRFKRAFPWVFVACIPYAWYLIVANHSYLHVWYTYRIQYLSVFGVVMGIGEFIDSQKVKRTIETIKRRISLFKFAN